MEVTSAPVEDETGLIASRAGEGPAWPWARWFTPGRCRAILFGLVVFGFWSHLQYLRNDCPIDLSGDEAQYWDWSRQLDWSYYSKGPLVAYIIRASTELFQSNEMWVVRLPAVVLASMTSLLTYWLTLRLFKSDRLALGAVLLNHIVPMFVAGSMLMTIDPPYFFCWALATAFLALAVLEEKKWAWIGVGLAVGVGILAKYGMLIWPIGMVIFLWLDGRGDGGRKNWLKTVWPWLAVGISLLFLTPPIIWNVQHDWVTLKHVAKQTGTTAQERFFNGNFFEFIGSQIGVLGPALAVILIGAVVYAVRRGRARAAVDAERPVDPFGRQMRLLLWTAAPLFLICVVMSIRSKMQVNWPAASYFSLMILAAYFLSTRLARKELWRPWRGWFWGAAVFGVAFIPIAHDFSLTYPLMARFKMEPRKWDMTAKMKGWEELGARLGKEMSGPIPDIRRSLPGVGGVASIAFPALYMERPFVLCEDYMQTAETAFYTPGNPITYCAGPYLADPKRHTQYDVWKNRRLNQPELRGRDAMYVGYLDDEKQGDVMVAGNLRKAFEKSEELEEEPIVQRGLKVRRFKIYRCIGFKGMEMKGGGY